MLRPPGLSAADFEAQLMQAIDAARPDAIALAGFMRILSAAFVERYLGRMLNIHPSLLPAYKGLHTHRRVLAAGEAEHGASVHFVTPELDAGPVVLQSKVRVRPDDSEDTLAARVHRDRAHHLPPGARLVRAAAAAVARWGGVARWHAPRDADRGGFPCGSVIDRAACAARAPGTADAALLALSTAAARADELKPFEASYNWIWHGLTVAASGLKLEKEPMTPGRTPPRAIHAASVAPSPSVRDR